MSHESTLLPIRRRVECVAQSISNEIQRKQCDDEHYAGAQKQPPTDPERIDLGHGLGEQSPETCVRRLDTEPEITQEALVEYDRRNCERKIDNHNSGDIGEHVSQHDSKPACAEGFRGQYKRPASQ